MARRIRRIRDAGAFLSVVHDQLPVLALGVDDEAARKHDRVGIGERARGAPRGREDGGKRDGDGILHGTALQVMGRAACVIAGSPGEPPAAIKYERELVLYWRLRK